MVKFVAPTALALLLIASNASAGDPELENSILDRPTQARHSAPLVVKVTADNLNYDSDSDEERTVIKTKVAAKAYSGGIFSGLGSRLASAWKTFTSLFSFWS